MPRALFASTLSIANKSNIVSAFLVGNAFIWYFAVLTLLQSEARTPLFWTVHFSSLILSAFAGASYARKMERSRFIDLWNILGILASIMVFAMGGSSELVTILVASFLGFSMGIGMPSCMSYFADHVPVEARGRVSGLAMFVTGIGIVAFGFADLSNLLSLGLILGIWRLSSFLIFRSFRNCPKTENSKRSPAYTSVLKQNSFLLYFIPWIMFSLVNYFAVPMTSTVSEDLAIVQFASLGGAAVIGGFLVDSVGRKRIAIVGFAMLGTGTAIIGLFGKEAPGIALLNAVIDGVAWGFLLVLFILTLWGDISSTAASEKYYALGAAPFFVSKLLELTVGFDLGAQIKDSTLFSVTAFFLFLAVLPLAYAPETLPEKVMKDRDLRSYVEKALKKVETETTRKKHDCEFKNDDLQFEVQSSEDKDEIEEAQRLAEKYY